MAYEGALLWDIDGTLLTTAKAGRIALREAVLELCGVEVDYGDLVTSGLTDTTVHAAALRSVGIEPDPELVARISDEYVRRLPETLPLKNGAVLPGVREALVALTAGGRIANLLLTGNTPGGARAKLARYRILEYFPHGGGFCEGDTERLDIARRALDLALELIENSSRERVVVIGDTPHDVACATTLGLRTVAISTGSHSLDELRATGACLVVGRLPTADELERLVLAS